MAKHLFTSESVTEGHPDKICDQISDAVLDAIFEQDPNGRVACETTASTGLIHIMGEITTSCYVDIPKIAREVIRDIGYDNAAMTVIPVGTGNDFLKNFGGAAPLFADAENLWDGPQFPMDAIDVNGRIALTIACSGIDARVAADVHKYSESPLLDGKTSYIASLAVNFLFKGIASHWTVTLDDEVIEDDFSLVAVCNGRYYGGGFMPVAEARMDDGVLNTLVVKKVSRVTFARFVGPYSKGEYSKFPEYAHCSTPQVVHIHSEKPDIVTCLDGECMTNSDVTIRLSEKKLNFFGPEGCSCNATAR